MLELIKPYWLTAAKWLFIICSFILVLVGRWNAVKRDQIIKQKTTELDYVRKSNELDKKVRQKIRTMPDSAKRDFLQKGTDDLYK